MPFPLFRRNRAARTIAALYGTIVAQARRPVFYREFGVSDSAEGRLEMLILHLALVLRRLEQGDEGLAGIGQGLFEHFCQDMDDNLREMGVGDLAVPKRMRRIAEAFYGRRAVYEAALARTDLAALADALRRNVFDGAKPDEAGGLALYVAEAARQLTSQSAQALANGRVEFPDPAPSAPGTSPPENPQ